MIEQLIAKVFCSRNASHLAHWRTGSYSEHQALGDFYDSVIDVLDKLVEAYMSGEKIGDVEEYPVDGSPILKHLQNDWVWINKNRKEIVDGSCALDNILQELEAVYMSTIFKLKRLS